MTADHLEHRESSSSRGGWTVGRVGSVVLGCVLALCALAALSGGVLALVGLKLSLGAHGRYHSPGYALVSDSTDWRTQLLGGIDSVRFQAAPEGSKPILVGVAKPAAVRSYLHGVRFTAVLKNGATVLHDGTAPKALPGAVHWTAHSSGTGIQTLNWNAGGGSQTLVAMNADGSPSVRARVVSSTVTLRKMPALAAFLLAGGAILVAISAALILGPVRRTRRLVRSLTALEVSNVER